MKNHLLSQSSRINFKGFKKKNYGKLKENRNFGASKYLSLFKTKNNDSFK